MTSVPEELLCLIGVTSNTFTVNPVFIDLSYGIYYLDDDNASYFLKVQHRLVMSKFFLLFLGAFCLVVHNSRILFHFSTVHRSPS